MIRTVEIPDEECKHVYTLNTWYERHLEDAYNYLKQGFYVHFDSTCIGHTLARMVQAEGIRWAQREFGDELELVYRKDWGDLYCKLKTC